MSRSSLADQLNALGVVGEPGPAKASNGASERVGKKHKPPHQAKLANYLIELPLWGEVGSLQVARGFGFLRSLSSPDDVFFHVTKRQSHPSKDLDDVRVGDPVVFYLGTEPNHPYKPCALRWALARDLPWEGVVPPGSQADFDELRRPLLMDKPFEVLLKLMQPEWYLRVWMGGRAPCNLHDSLLQYVFFERLEPLDVTELAAFAPPPADWVSLANVQESQKLMLWYLRYSKGVMTPAWEARFQARDNHEAIVVDRYIEQDLPRTEFIVAWVEKIIAKGWLTAPSVLRWIDDDRAAALRHFRLLPVERRLACLAHWRHYPDELTLLLQENPGISTRDFLLSSVLALDLETDGGRIWEMGCARGGEASLLFGRGNGTDLNAAMMQLQAQADAAPLLVGHNIVAWDWPILSSHLHLEPAPLLWDTLLVQYLLEPQAKSHALGGSHHADGDALLAANLFEKQFKCLPFEFAARVLSGEFLDTSDLLDALALVVDGCSCTRVMPAWLAERRGSPAILVLPARYLTQVDWLPGVTVVSANPAESLPLALLQLDLDLLESALAGEVGRAPAARVLLMVARRAAAQGIALRYGMLPPWLLEQHTELDLAVRRSCCVPHFGLGIRVAPLPVDVQSILAAGPEAFHLVGFDCPVLVHDQRAKALPQFAEMTKGHGAASLLRLEEPGAGPLWLLADGAARRMEIGGGWRSFRTQLVDKALIELLPPSDVPQRPVLVTRNDPVLYPGTFDQASYWVGVIRTLIEVRSRHLGAEGVAILLVSSSNSPELVDLLRVALAEVGLGEIKSDHHSRLAQLQRAVHQQGILVDFLEHWPQWLALARFAEITLLPVVEALPLEQWFAMSSAQEDAQSLADENDAKAPGAGAGSFDEDDLLDEEADASTADEPPALVSEKGGLASCLPVSAGDVLQRAAKLVEDFLSSWLQSSGLAESRQPVVLLDSRLVGQAKALKKFVEPFLLAAAPLPAAQADGLRLALEPLQIRRELAPDDYEALERFLVKNWQSSDASKGNPIVGFKDSQKPAMQAISSRSSDVLVALPTGEGKSVLFQVPALCRGLRTRRLTLVLSPLKALMRDQVQGLRDKGFAESADFLSGDRPWHEIVDVYQGVMDHRIVLLYVAPERFRSAMFLNVLRQRIEVDGVLEYAVVDETHCVNQWGYEFRPDYFYALQHLLSNYRTAADGEKTPFLLLSATLTASDKARLRGILGDDSAGQAPAALPLLALPERYMPPLRDHIEVIPQRVHGNIWDRDSFAQVLAERVRVIVPYIEAALVNRARTGQRSAVIIFVTRRRHAEELAQALAKATRCQVDYFHAGLNAGAREQLLEDVKNSKLDVLVATKAFGMGMDIPDIHWAIHLGPPAYLEDYLQEVGRIGRDEAKREKAQLGRLQATLLYSSADFEHIRSLRATSAINLAGIKQFYERICEVAEPAGQQWVAIVPHAGLESKDDSRQKVNSPTQVRMLLYWLERAGKLVLRSSVPNLLPVKLHHDVLQRISSEAGNQGKLAKVILEMGEVSELTLQPGKDSDIHARLDARPEPHWLESLLTRLGDMVGLIFGKKTAKPVPSQNPAAPSTAGSPVSRSADEVAVINLAQIMLRCSFATLGDAMAELVTLERHGALELRRQFQFSRRSLGDEPMPQINALFKMIDEAHQELLRRLSDQGRLRFALSELLQGFTSPQVDDATRTSYQKAFQWGLITLARMSGISMRQLVEKDEEVIWEVRLPSALQRRTEQRKKTTLAIARNVLGLLRSPACRESRTVLMRDLIEASQAASSSGRFREADLHKALNFLSAMQLISLSADLLPMSYVLTLERLNESLDEHKELWDELEEVNRFSELRNDAMEVFANLPSERQDAFLEGYFAQADVKGLESFLLSQLGEIDSQNDAGLSKFIKDKQEHLRASAVTEFFERYQQSEEPNQWAAMRHPYDRHLLVNAGPGAGKTAVLVGRIVHLIREQHIQPSEIVVLAFNRAVVFEIRKRIKALFGTLGYASYVSRLRVATFHSFAMRELALVDGDRNDSVDRKNILGVFAERLAKDANFCRQVARDVRCILVDEFQDVTDDIYDIIRQLQQGSGNKAGIMVIGDDDQDILRWNRPDKAFSEEYFERFRLEFGGDKLVNLALRVNFRSGAAIVEKSQQMIEAILACNHYSKRLKDFTLTARCNQPVAANVKRLSLQEFLDAEPWDKALLTTKLICVNHINDANGSFAILCRSNAEVAKAYQYLAPQLSDLAVQGGANYRVGDLRHVALWREFLETEMAKQNRLLTDELKDALIAQFNQGYDIPETREPSNAIPSLEELWNLCCQERAFAHLSDLVDFIDDLQTDALERLRGVLHDRLAQMISTIHKVKGMEYDRVIILPSLSGFGSGGANEQSLAMDAAEEARLFYVGMTRAKHFLTYFVGGREYAWGRCRSFTGERSSHNKILSGTHEEVFLSWSMNAAQNTGLVACQAYIEKQIRVGDRIFFSERGPGAFRGLFHQRDDGNHCQVGAIAKRFGTGSSSSSLRVSAVIRFHPDSVIGLAQSVQQQGWGYVVLVEGQL